GVYCCGPAPVRAVKEGDLGIKYDVPFLFAEVNADMVYYVKQRDGTTRKTLFTAIVGQNISTQAIGLDVPEDITHTYKYPEGSDDERRVFEKASKVNATPLQAAEQEERLPGVSIKIKVSEEMDKGSDFDVFVVMTNSTEEEKVCRLMFSAQTASYSGEVGTECGKKDLINLRLPAKG
ncbi:hypothetical protein FKM82_030073, partial [Ascaphus truei]